MFINCVYISVEQNTFFLVLYEPVFLKGMMYCPELLQVVIQPAQAQVMLGQFEYLALISKRKYCQETFGMCNLVACNS